MIGTVCLVTPSATLHISRTTCMRLCVGKTGKYTLNKKKLKSSLSEDVPELITS